MSRALVGRANALISVILPILFAALAALTWNQIASTRRARLWSDHTYNVLADVGALDLAIRKAETGQRGYLLTGNPSYLKPYEEALGRVPEVEGDLQRLTGDNPLQQQRLAALAPVLQQKLAELAGTIELRRKIGLPAALQVVQNDSGLRLMADIEDRLDSFAGTERSLLHERLGGSRRSEVVLRGLELAVMLVGILGFFVATRLLNRAYARASETQEAQGALARRLRACLDSLSQGVGVFDRDLRLVQSNACFRTLLDLPSALVREATPYGAIAEHLGGGAPFLEAEAQLRAPHALVGAPVSYERKLEDGRLLELRRTSMADDGFVLTVSDLTERSRAEAVLRESQKMDAIGHLTGGIAHDFNNLLTVILGNLDFARLAVDQDHPIQGRIERATWAAQRGATLTSQLLTFARKQALAPAAIDLGAVVPELVPLLQRTLGEHIEIRFVGSAGLWAAMADAAQLENVVINLALNARDAMQGGGRLTIELANKVLDAEYAAAHVEVTAGDYVMLAVSDTGHGMDQATLARVFEPFFTTKPPGKGTGLGLAMVFGFVKQSGGHVKIYSEPEHGTTVRIYLPRAVGVATSATMRQAPAAPPRGSAAILLVEDSPEVREISAAMLRDQGYQVFEAGDAEEALRVFGAHAADIALLLTDVVLPGRLRGRDLAERITQLRPELPVLFMSGYTENAIVHHGRLDDGVQLISKPFKREELARRVAAILGPIAERQDAENVVELRPLHRGE